MGLINKKDRKSRDYYLCVHAYMYMLSVAYRPSKRTDLSYVAVPALQFGGELPLVAHLISYRESKKCT